MTPAATALLDPLAAAEALELDPPRSVTTDLGYTDAGTSRVALRILAHEVFAVDARPLLRSGLAALARRAFGSGVRAFADLDQAMATVEAEGGAAPRALVLGLRAGEDPQPAVERARHLDAPVVCALDVTDAGLARRALATGADGYLALATADAQGLRATLRAIEAGARVIPAELRPEKCDEHRAALTARCLDVLRALADGLHDEEIAARLEISVSSVRKHIASAQDRLGARTRTQVVAIVASSGLV
jgi:DNA-binding NarL/FixJ family response regulator